MIYLIMVMVIVDQYIGKSQWRRVRCGPTKT
jgi:hypothetical protein